MKLIKATIWVGLLSLGLILAVVVYAQEPEATQMAEEGGLGSFGLADPPPIPRFDLPPTCPAPESAFRTRDTYRPQDGIADNRMNTAAPRR